VYSAVDREEREGRDYRLFADIVAGQLAGARQRDRAVATAREWGAYLVGRSVPRPGARGTSGPNLAVLQEALAEAGFDPRFRRRGRSRVDRARLSPHVTRLAIARTSKLGLKSAPVSSDADRRTRAAALGISTITTSEEMAWNRRPRCRRTARRSFWSSTAGSNTS